ncbi:MAG TPA: hypothetical protein VML75_15085, partial [Kofleriaceae bacterium]|nr:hypothetical protein [Kofleriaceae bacterium]
MILRAAGVVAAALLLSSAGSARAGEPVRDEGAYYQLVVPDGWVASQAAAGTEDILLARTR